MLSPEAAVTVSGLGYVGLPLVLEFGKKYLTLKEHCPVILHSKAAQLVRKLQDFGSEVFVDDPTADPAKAQHEFGILLTPLKALPQADALIAAVPLRRYPGMPIDDLQSKLRPADVFVDVKPVYPPQAMTEIGLRV
jgi:UDP-N-acetyl-D-galactosamine dehydrogenase